MAKVQWNVNDIGYFKEGSLRDGWKVVVDPRCNRMRIDALQRAEIVCVFAEIIARMSSHEAMMTASYFCGLIYDDAVLDADDAKELAAILMKTKYVFECIDSASLDPLKALSFADFVLQGIEDEECIAESLRFSMEQTKALTCFLRMLLPRNSM